MVAVSVLGYDIALVGLPGLWPAVPDGTVRVSVNWSAPWNGLKSDRRWWAVERTTGLTVGWSEEAEFRVEIEPEPHVEVTLGPVSAEYAALSFVLSVLPLALPLFDLEPLHGVALGLDDHQALMVMGESESGKSTTAAALRAMGLRFLADDACAIDADGQLWPGPPFLTTRVLSPGARVFAEYDGKSVLAIDGHPTHPYAPAAAIILRPAPGEELALQRLTGVDAFRAVLGQVRAPWALPRGRRSLQLEVVARVAVGPVAVLTFDHARHAPGVVAELVLSWLGATGYHVGPTSAQPP